MPPGRNNHEDFIETLATETFTAKENIPRISGTHLEQLKMQLISSTVEINKPHERYKNDTTKTEQIPWDLLESGEIFEEAALTDLNSNFSRKFKHRVAQTTKQAIFDAKTLLEEDNEIFKDKIKINRTTINTALVYAYRASIEQAPELEDERTYQGRTRGNLAEETDVTISIAKLKPETGGAIEDKLNTWSKRKTISNVPALQNLSELADNEKLVIMIQAKNSRTLLVIATTSDKTDHAQADEHIVRYMEHFAGVQKDIEEIIGEDTENKTSPNTLYLFSNHKYVPRATSAGQKNGALITLEGLGEFLHEEVHLEMDARYGRNFVGIMVEGATTYIESRLLPEQAINVVIAPITQKDIFKKMCEKIPVEQLSWNAKHMHEEADLNFDVNSKEFVYPFARLFAEFFIEKYGKDEYFKLYAATAEKQNTLVNSKTGKTIIFEEEVVDGATETEILEAGLLSIGIDPDKLKEDLYKYIKNL